MRHMRFNGIAALVLGAGALTSISAAAAEPSEWLQVDVSDHICGIKTNNTLWCWGGNYYGQLGLGHNDRVDVPTRVGSGRWKQVTVGTYHTCAISSSGLRYCWGANERGQLGLYDTKDRNRPIRVLAETTWDSVEAGSRFTCGLRGGGSLYCWGENHNGQLGVGDFVGRTGRTRVGSDTDWASVSAGSQHTCGTKYDGRAYCWGAPSELYNQDHALGIPGVGKTATPAQLTEAVSWSSISASHWFTCGLGADQTRFCWGRNRDYQLGLRDSYARAQPTSFVEESSTWSKISAGLTHACGIRWPGSLACWGKNHLGQLGQGSRSPRHAELPLAVIINGRRFNVAKAVVAGSNQTCAIAMNGYLYCWGAGSAVQSDAPLLIEG